MWRDLVSSGGLSFEAVNEGRRSRSVMNKDLDYIFLGSEQRGSSDSLQYRRDVKDNNHARRRLWSVRGQALRFVTGPARRRFRK